MPSWVALNTGPAYPPKVSANSTFFARPIVNMDKPMAMLAELSR